MTVTTWSYLRAHWKGVLTLMIPVLVLPLPLVVPGDEAKCGAMALIMALYWMLDLLPLAVTALLPVALAPPLAILGTNDVSMLYMRGTCMLFLGGLIMAAAVEECNLHRRIALNALRLFGTSPRFIMMGFMVPTSFLSMWISNTATTAMMIPIMEAVLEELKTTGDYSESQKEASGDNTSPNKGLRKTRAMLALSICYSANVGGTATIIGSTPNLAFVEYLDAFPDNPVSFGTYMGFAVPQAVLCLVVIYMWLSFYFIGLVSRDENEDRAKAKETNVAVARMIKQRCLALGTITYHEMSVLTVFLLLVLLWFFRQPKFMPGWADQLKGENAVGDPVGVGDATPAILMTSMLFFLPAEPHFLLDLLSRNDFSRRAKTSAPLIDWKTAQSRVPWEILILIGGGFALAEASSRSCLSALLGSYLGQLEGLPTWLVVLIGSVVAALLTQIASNTASAGILLPILRDLALELRVNPLFLMFPPTLVCSYAFMLPVSTGPNAIAFRVSKLSVFEMVKVGTVLNVICLAVVMLAINTYGYAMFDLDEFPEWAASPSLGNDTNLCSY